MEIAKDIVYKKISEIRPYIRNARQNEKTVSLLVQIIPKVGFNVPIVIDEKGIIVKGHARYMAAIRLDMKEVPCIVSHASEDDIKLDRIADNLISEFSEWVTDDLLDELRNLDVDFDMGELGLPDFHHALNDDDRVGAIYVDPDDAESAFQTGIDSERSSQPEDYYKCTCPRCAHIQFMKASEVENG